MDMLVKDNSCHGTFECLRLSSSRRVIGLVAKIHQKPRSYLVWLIENLGWRAALRHAFVKAFTPWSWLKERLLSSGGTSGLSAGEETLDLWPGELVEVKSVDEVLATLDSHRRHKGLLWMTGMRKYCGTRCRVYRKVEKIMLESNGQLRNMKNTVLLEGVMCDGVAFGGCDRSCFHFWREVWLRRVPEQEANGPLNGQRSQGKSEV